MRLRVQRRLSSKPIKPDLENEDFLIWLEHPMTRAMLGKLKSIEEKAKAAWMEASWTCSIDKIQDGFPELLLMELRARADLARSMREMKYASIAPYRDDKQNAK